MTISENSWGYGSRRGPPHKAEGVDDLGEEVTSLEATGSAVYSPTGFLFLFYLYAR